MSLNLVNAVPSYQYASSLPAGAVVGLQVTCVADRPFRRFYNYGWAIPPSHAISSFIIITRERGNASGRDCLWLCVCSVGSQLQLLEALG